MLPNYKIMIGAFLLSVILFAMTGVGIVMPETYTRIGEMPEVSRPMMQRMITDEPEQARFRILNLVRRSEELGRLRQLALLDVPELTATAQPLPVEPAMVEKSEPDAVTAPTLMTVKIATAPTGSSTAEPVEAPSIADVAAGPTPSADLRSDEALGTATAGGAGPSEAPMVAALPATPPDDVAPTAPITNGKIRIPRVRPAARASIRRRPAPRTHHIARAPSIQPGLFGQTAFPSR